MFLNFPDSHDVQTPSEERVYPMLQEQFLESELPVCENEYGIQRKHTEEADLFEKVPFGHRRQELEPLIDLYRPSLQLMQT